MNRYRISFAGAGNVASSLSIRLKEKGHLVHQIISRNREKGTALANLCDAQWSDKPEFDLINDIVIVAVPDRSVSSVLENIKCGDGTIVVHTAGSYGLEVFPSSVRKCGVFYPLQTFSKGREIDITDIPVFIEANDRETCNLLGTLAESLGCRAVFSDTEHRRLLHVAAVFVSNFTNYMLTSGERISARAGFSPDLLRPLINETVSKALEQGPSRSQTGPAIRFDYNTIEKHLELLSFSPELQTVYEEISRSIMNFYKQQEQDEQF
jgi:predicted short-subunit dehydrogenase-like oxidoreductase (DUF2520 family)